MTAPSVDTSAHRRTRPAVSPTVLPPRLEMPTPPRHGSPPTVCRSQRSAERREVRRQQILYASLSLGAIAAVLAGAVAVLDVAR